MQPRLEPVTAAELFDAHAVAVHAYLARRVGGDAADDLLGDVFAVVVRRWPSLGATVDSPLAWLYGVAHRVLAAELRGRGMRLRLEGVLADAAHADGADRATEADDRMDAARLRPALVSGLLALPVDDRDVLLLVACEQLTPSEAAAALAIPAGTARSRLHRARQTLRTHLEDLA